MKIFCPVTFGVQQSIQGWWWLFTFLLSSGHDVVLTEAADKGWSLQKQVVVMERLFFLTDLIQLCLREKVQLRNNLCLSQTQKTTVPYKSYKDSHNSRLKKKTQSYQVYNCRHVKRVLVWSTEEGHKRLRKQEGRTIQGQLLIIITNAEIKARNYSVIRHLLWYNTQYYE